MITVIARAEARPGKEAALEKAWRLSILPSHQEEGCLFYTLQRSKQNPSVFLSVEGWVSPEALDRHMASPHVQTLIQTVSSLITAPPEITVYDPLPEGDPHKGVLR